MHFQLNSHQTEVEAGQPITLDFTISSPNTWHLVFPNDIIQVNREHEGGQWYIGHGKRSKSTLQDRGHGEPDLDN